MSRMGIIICLCAENGQWTINVSLSVNIRVYQLLLDVWTYFYGANCDRSFSLSTASQMHKNNCLAICHTKRIGEKKLRTKRSSFLSASRDYAEHESSSSFTYKFPLAHRHNVRLEAFVDFFADFFLFRLAKMLPRSTCIRFRITFWLHNLFVFLFGFVWSFRKGMVCLNDVARSILILLLTIGSSGPKKQQQSRILVDPVSYEGPYRANAQEN